MSEPEPTPEDHELDEELELALAPLHKRNLGLAVAAAGAVLMLLATLLHLLRSPDEEYPLILLAQYFPGYSITWGGAVVGALWGAFVGFFVGWFFAFCRNLSIAVATFLFRAREELSQGRGFLDQI